MKESITKFDLEAAFKALDEIEIPLAEKGIKANKPALTEIFSRKSKFDALFEEYYDIGNTEELSDAKEVREAEVAKAKLARIEKIVDLDAESPEDLLTSYVGKYIIQCPQCMTLFYKNPEDVEESEDDSTVVNVNEVCQHCGNESGYTLVGKVGEATPEEPNTGDTEFEATDETAENVDETESDTENSEETTGDEEDFDLDSDLEELDLNIEEDESETNESLSAEATTTTSLTEDLTEDTELETSAEDFEKLINSPEFKKPISDTDARAMMQEINDTEKSSKKDDVKESADLSAPEKLQEVSENPKHELADIDEDNKVLEEGILDKIKDKFIDTIDKITGKLKSREAKANWIRDTAREDYSDIKVATDGKLIPDEKTQRFHNFIVIGFKDRYTNNKLITTAPSFNNKDLVIGKDGVQVKKKYEDADAIAKGWSLGQDRGPAFIYLAKDADDDNAVFLCEYFNGELEYDQLDKYFDVVKKDLKAGKLLAKGGMHQEETDTTDEVEDYSEDSYEILSVTDLKSGMRIEDSNYTFTVEDKKINLNGEVIKCMRLPAEKVKNGADVGVVVRFDDGETRGIAFKPDQKILVKLEESLSKLMVNLEELQEDVLEKSISNSLIENFDYIAGFRLKDCQYLNEKLTINGKLLFTSGKIENTTYTCSEAFIKKDNKIVFCGLNESLGLNKYFTITGYTSNADKVFITESFKCK